MESSGGGFELTAEVIKRVDAVIDSPERRASVVWKLLQQHGSTLTTWDILVFAAEYIGFQSQEYPWLEEDAKALLRLIYTAHYYNGLQRIRAAGSPWNQDTGVEPDREHETGSPRSDAAGDNARRSSESPELQLPVRDPTDSKGETTVEETTRPDGSTPSGTDEG